MKQVLTLMSCLVFIAAALGGCAQNQSAVLEGSGPGSSPLAAYDSPDFQPGGLVMVAAHAKTPVKIDGKLDDAVWQRAKAYPMYVVRKKKVPNFPLQEQGEIRLAWDSEYFYIAGRFQDKDVVQNATKDNIFLYSFGDTMEVFFKPRSKHWYWEFYGTPRNHKTTLFYVARGRFGLNPFPFVKNSGLKVASIVHGTINDWPQLDQGFDVEMAIPMDQLKHDAPALGPDNHDWTILVARYNHSAYADTFQSELSTTPYIPQPNFHIFEYWASLKLEKPLK